MKHFTLDSHMTASVGGAFYPTGHTFVMFPDALAHAAETCGLRLLAVPEKDLAAQVEQVMAMPVSDAMKKVAMLGKSVGPPWGADQKNATLAAMIALAERRA